MLIVDALATDRRVARRARANDPAVPGISVDAPPFTTVTVMGPAAARVRVAMQRREERLRTGNKATSLLGVTTAAKEACMMFSVWRTPTWGTCRSRRRFRIDVQKRLP